MINLTCNVYGIYTYRKNRLNDWVMSIKCSCLIILNSASEFVVILNINVFYLYNVLINICTSFNFKTVYYIIHQL